MSIIFRTRNIGWSCLVHLRPNFELDELNVNVYSSPNQGRKHVSIDNTVALANTKADRKRTDVTMSQDALRTKILNLTRQYAEMAHKPKRFIPGVTKVHYAGRVFDGEEVMSLVSSSLDFWLTAGPYAERFEYNMRDYFDAAQFLLVNSGSSANLLMVSAMAYELSPKFEIITPAVTFPTTLAPIIQNGLVPVFVDVDLPTYNIDPALIEAAIGPKTRAIFIPHTLGIPCDMTAITSIAAKHQLWLIEDGCDSLGSEFLGQKVGTFGDMSSCSFYPAHHITMGEGGGVVINNHELADRVRSMRDWGRACHCKGGQDNACGSRFTKQCGDLPYGYDHKYTYNYIGYNLKVTDMQAAIGVAQFKKLPQFIEARRRNFKRLYDGLRHLEGQIILPKIDPRANPSPFGFPITVNGEGIRRKLIDHLERALIETRLLFGGNITKQPGFLDIEKRVSGDLTQSDRVMNGTFFVGVYPGLGPDQIDYMIECIERFFS